MIPYKLAAPLLSRVDPELAHRLTILALRSNLVSRAAPIADACLTVRLFGLDFINPVGLAAGFDKNAEVAGAMLGQGFGFVEIGTVTPLPQSGNPRPRLFRLVEDGAVINRLGFNNAGHGAIVARLTGARHAGTIGVNVGANRDSADRTGDYVMGITTFNRLAAYLVLNISSPNTPGLRTLQQGDELDDLLARAMEARASAAVTDGRAAPLLVKLAPDLTDPELETIAGLALKHRVDGLIIGNTTLTRPTLHGPYATESGGLSGRPLFALSTRVLARMYRLVGQALPLIGVGGISSPEDAWVKITAGASLIQLYSALIYQGPGLVRDIHLGLIARMHQDGHDKLATVVGRDAARWA